MNDAMPRQDRRRSASELQRLQLLPEEYRAAHVAVGDVLQIVDLLNTLKITGVYYAGFDEEVVFERCPE